MSNLDIAVLAKKVVQFSLLTPAELEARQWEALLFLGSIYGSASPEGIAAAKKSLDERWGAAIAKGGLKAIADPRWHLRSDDGKPPVLQLALVSALENPKRTLSTRLLALTQVPPDEREPLTDLVRALTADAFAGATGAAKMAYIDAMRAVGAIGVVSKPWLAVLPRGNAGPPIQILLDDQGVGANDGGVLDKDPTDDPLWETAIRTWDVDFLRDNPLAQAFIGTTDVAGAVVDAVSDTVKGAAAGAHALATLIRWAPWIAAASAVAVTTGLVIRAVRA